MLSRNLFAHIAASNLPPIVVSAMTHSTFDPSGYLRLSEMSFAAALAMSMVWTSSDSLTPRRRPSMIGRMPTLGKPLWVNTVCAIFLSSPCLFVACSETFWRRRDAAGPIGGK